MPGKKLTVHFHILEYTGKYIAIYLYHYACGFLLWWPVQTYDQTKCHDITLLRALFLSERYVYVMLDVCPFSFSDSVFKIHLHRILGTFQRNVYIFNA